MPDAIILAVDTCFGACSAAVTRGATVLASRIEVMERGHAEALAPMVADVLREASLAFAAIDCLAVTIGPGTFTGQRVGLAFMRGLRVALGKPLVGVTSLGAMAERARHLSGCEIAAAVHDAKRGEVYLERVGDALAAQVMTFDDAVELLRKCADIAITGTAAPRIAELVAGAKLVEASAPDAVWVARVALTADDAGAPRPLYLRAPDARLPR